VNTPLARYVLRLSLHHNHCYLMDAPGALCHTSLAVNRSQQCVRVLLLGSYSSTLTVGLGLLLDSTLSHGVWI